MSKNYYFMQRRRRLRRLCSTLDRRLAMRTMYVCSRQTGRGLISHITITTSTTTRVYVTFVQCIGNSAKKNPELQLLLRRRSARHCLTFGRAQFPGIPSDVTSARTKHARIAGRPVAYTYKGGPARRRPGVCIRIGLTGSSWDFFSCLHIGDSCS